MEKLSERSSLREMIDEVRKRLQAENLPGSEIFARAMKETLDKAVRSEPDGSTFVLTGDIPAMWLRDAACQVRPYLFLAKEDEAFGEMIEGLVQRMVQCILIDPYANAFNEEANGRCWAPDETDMKPEIWERKFEIDSLCFPVQLAYVYWKMTGKTGHFTEDFLKAARSILQVFRTEQDHENSSPYHFVRRNTRYTDTLPREGKGTLVNARSGLIWSGFRPSDDACVFGYLIPSNMFAVVILQYLSQIAEEVYSDREFAAACEAFSTSLREAVEEQGTVTDPYGEEECYAYEADGYGNYLLMDDANLPSLLAMPYLGYCSPENPKYQTTRRILLAEGNPYYYKGSVLSGIGSAHTPPGYVWPIALGIQAMTAGDKAKEADTIRLLAESEAGTGHMHEGVCADDPEKYTREWFSWSDAVFCELVLDYLGYEIPR